jgi:hypothetical protein
MSDAGIGVPVTAKVSWPKHSDVRQMNDANRMIQIFTGYFSSPLLVKSRTEIGIPLLTFRLPPKKQTKHQKTKKIFFFESL